MKGACIALLLSATAASAFALEFRNTSWMMSRQQVIDSEGGRVVSELDLEGQQQIVFKSLVNGFAATITYTLENDELLSASYTFARDSDRQAWDMMKQDLTGKNGPPSFEKENLIGWRLPRTEIALAHLKDGTTYVAYWEKSYFARINGQAGPRSSKN